MENYGSLLKGGPWLEYAVRVNILKEDKKGLSGLRDRALQDEKIKSLLDNIAHFHDTPVSYHRNPALPVNQLLFLLELGFGTDVPQVGCAVNLILENKDENGVYMSRGDIPESTPGEKVYGWALCDAPLMLLALSEAGADYKKHIKQGADYLASLFSGPGYPCRVSMIYGNYRGPGRKDECCPYATLAMLRLFSRIPGYASGKYAVSSSDYILDLWENSLEKHPFMFYMGTDFRKLKAPAVWYDIVSVAGVLSAFDYLKNDKRLIEMVETIKGKRDVNGLFTPEAVYKYSKGWEFGQKKEPSLYLTYLCEKIFLNMGM